MPYEVSEMCLTNYKDRFIFISGGQRNLSIIQSVMKYDVKNDHWSAAPSMIENRKLHNSVTF